MKTFLMALIATLTGISAILLFIIAIYGKSIRRFLILGANTGSDWYDKTN